MITDDDISDLIKQIRTKTKVEIELTLFRICTEQTIVLR